MPNADELARDLDEMISDDTEDINSPPTPPDTQEQADRRARSLRRVTEDLASIDELANTRIDEIHAWQSLRSAPLLARFNWLKASLVAFAVNRKAQAAEKTQRFTSGVQVKLTPPRGSLVVLDEAAFMTWAKTNAPDLIVTPPQPEPTIDKNAAKALFIESKIQTSVGEEWEIEYVTVEGETVPGIVLRKAKTDSPSVTIKSIDEPDGEA